MSIETVYKKLREQPIDLDEVQKRRVLSHVLAWRAWPRRSKAPWIVAAAAVVAAAIAVTLVLVLDLPGHGLLEDRPAAGDGDQPTTLALAGLGRAILQPGADVSIVTKSDTRLVATQAGGSVRYEIDRPAGHQVIVRAGGYEIEVVGTVFDVALERDELTVRVIEGVVAVADGERTVELVAGDEITMAARDGRGGRPEADPDSPRPQEETSSPEQGVALGSANDSPPTTPLPPGRNEAVPAATSPGTPADPEQEGLGEPPAPSSLAGPEATVSPAPSIEEMLGQVDAARRRGALAEASRLLDQIVMRFPTDPRSVNALFTMGNVERQRGNQAKAARAYERCWKLNPSGLLAEDARAEAAVSWAAAGRKGLAKEAARSYLELYPRGNHVERMKSLIE